MWPQNLLAKLEQPENFESNDSDNKECQFDEFGFRIEDEEGSQSTASKVTFDPISEDDQQRFAYSHILNIIIWVVYILFFILGYNGWPILNFRIKKWIYRQKAPMGSSPEQKS